MHIITPYVTIDGHTAPGDGYTVMDKHLDGLDPTGKIDWNDPASNVNTLGQDQ